MTEYPGKLLTLALRSDSNPIWMDSSPTFNVLFLSHLWSDWNYFSQAILSNVLLGGTFPDAEYSLNTTITEPDYENNINKFGFMLTSTTVTQSNTNKQLKIELLPTMSVVVVDVNEQATRFKWKWIVDHYEDEGFFTLDFDLALNVGTLFIFEVLDKDIVVKLSKSTNIDGWITPPIIYFFCGEEVGYEASKTKDGNITTIWKHTFNELHTIIFDMGVSKITGGVKIYFGGSTSGWLTNIYITDNIADFGTPIVDNWDVSGAAEWKTINFIASAGRYIKITMNPYNTDNYLDDFNEIQFFTYEHQTIIFKSFAWEMRLRCKTTGTSVGTEYVDIRNIKINKYQNLGTAEMNWGQYISNINNYDEILLNTSKPEGTNVKTQLAFSDDNITWSNFVGPDGTSGTFFEKSGDIITVPPTYTGYYYKWKNYLLSDGRNTPILYDLTIWMFVNILQNIINLEKRLSYPLLPANPLMRPTISLVKSTWDSFLIETLSGQSFTGKVYILTKGEFTVWIPDTLSKYERVGKVFVIAAVWSESTVGQVLSGWVRNQNENIITDGVKVIVTSTYAEGLDQMGSVNKTSGFYQVFIRNTIYDGRYLLVELDTKTFDAAFRMNGLPILIDGTTSISSPQDLHFWKPTQICGKSIAHVDSLVTY